VLEANASGAYLLVNLHPKVYIMLQYNTPLNNFEASRSTGYKFTVTSKDDPSLLNLKRNVRIANSSQKFFMQKYYNKDHHIYSYDTLKKRFKLYKVSLMGRGPRRWHTYMSQNVPLYHELNEVEKVSLINKYREAMQLPHDNKNSKYLHFDCDRSLRHNFASRFDVYVHRDSNHERKFITFLEDDLSFSAQNKIAKLERDILAVRINSRKYIRNTKVLRQK